MNTSMTARGEPPRPRPPGAGLLTDVREATIADIDMLTSLLMQLSPAACLQRYLMFRRFTPETARAEATRMLGGHGRQRVALIATRAIQGAHEVIGVAELVRLDEGSALGEAGVVVRDDLQGAGVGTMLMEAIRAAAPTLGISALHMDVLASNGAMRRLAARLGSTRTRWAGDGALRLLVALEGYASPSGPRQSYAPAAS